MMPSEKIAQFSSAPPLNKLKRAATLPPCFSVSDRSAEADDHDHREREQNTPPQFRYLDRV
jgi:hypothetical protein